MLHASNIIVNKLGQAPGTMEVTIYWEYKRTSREFQYSLGIKEINLAHIWRCEYTLWKEYNKGDKSYIWWCEYTLWKEYSL